MKKTPTIKVVVVKYPDKPMYYLRIIEQPRLHVGWHYKASNGILLVSEVYPAYSGDILYLRGSEHTLDDKDVLFYPHEMPTILRMLEAVIECNERHPDGVY